MSVTMPRSDYFYNLEIPVLNEKDSCFIFTHGLLGAGIQPGDRHF
jgi:hypothetical protein